MTMHAAHGMWVRSAVPLPGLPQVEEGHDAVELRWSESRPIADELPDGVILMRCTAGGRLWYSATATAAGYHLRFNGCCQFDIDRSAKTVDIHMHTGVDPELGAVIAAGSLVSFLLALNHHTVLHASAVDTPHGVVALTGQSSAGKSTVAALACAGGLSLVTDDVLRIDRSNGLPTATRGADEIRLRRASTDVVEQFTVPVATRETVDGRLAVRPPAADADARPLTAVIVPRPCRDRPRVAVRRLSVAAGMVQLLAMPRLLGWEDPAVLQRQFDDLADLVRRVPVVELDVPWGPPFGQLLGRQVAARMLEVAAGAALRHGNDRRGAAVRG